MKFKTSCNSNITNVKHYNWIVFCVIAMGTFMATLDSSIVNIALPKISAQLKVTPTVAGWIVTSYLLVLSSLLLFFGKVGDLLGRRKLYSYGFLVFILGSLFCALSENITLLIASRVLQGVGAAMLMANSPAIIAEVFSNGKRGRALGMAGTIVALGTMTGPTVGGLLIGKFGWQSIFFINIPIGILGFLLGIMLLPCDITRKKINYDLKGSILFIIGTFCFLLLLSQGHHWGWYSPLSISIIISSIFFFILFIRIEQKAQHPMIDFSLLKNKTFLIGNISAMCSFISIFSNIILLPFFLDRVLNLDSFTMGLLITPFPLALAIVAPISGYLSEKYSIKLLTMTGLFITMLGLLFFTLVDENTTGLQIALGQFVLGLGNGIFQAPNNNSIISSIEPSKLGIGSGISALGRNLGMIAGVAISLSIFQSLWNVLVQSGEVINSFITAYHAAIATGALFAGLGAIISLERKDIAPQQNN